MEHRSYDVDVTIGQPVPSILAAARARNADLIIMGTHLRHGWRRALAEASRAPSDSSRPRRRSTFPRALLAAWTLRRRYVAARASGAQHPPDFFNFLARVASFFSSATSEKHAVRQSSSLRWNSDFAEASE